MVLLKYPYNAICFFTGRVRVEEPSIQDYYNQECFAGNDGHFFFCTYCQGYHFKENQKRA